MAHGLYWVGHYVEKLVPHRDCRIGDFLGNLYQRIMATAVRVQGDGDGPWERNK